MKYYLFSVGEKEYKLRLTAQSTIDTEKRLGKSIIGVMMESGNGNLPKLEDMLTILSGSMQVYKKGVNAYAVYDEYIENGGDFTGLIEVITEVLKVSGFFKETAEGE